MKARAKSAAQLEATVFGGHCSSCRVLATHEVSQVVLEGHSGQDDKWYVER